MIDVSPVSLAALALVPLFMLLTAIAIAIVCLAFGARYFSRIQI
jgi:hypothetical protein